MKTPNIPLVSVILPTYNRAHLLPCALASVLEQDYTQIEVIVVDDGSTDCTPDVVRGFADARVRYIRLDPNKGPGSARQTGLRDARGRYVALCDSDDVWLPGKLTYQVHVMESNMDVDITFGDFWNVNDVTGAADLGFRQTSAGLAMLTTEQRGDDFFAVLSGMPEAMLRANFIALPTTVFRREMAVNTGGFDTSLRGAEDMEFWWRASLVGARFGYTTRTLIERRKGSDSLSWDSPRFLREYLVAVDAMARTASTAGRLDLLPLLRYSKHKAWCGLVRAHAVEGRRRDALGAFAQSLRFGLSARAAAFLLGALAGPRAIRCVRSVRAILLRPGGRSV